MAHLFRLSDDAWAAIDRHLPRERHVMVDLPRHAVTMALAMKSR